MASFINENTASFINEKWRVLINKASFIKASFIND